MALKVNDVITRDFVRETVEEIVQEDLVWRQAFREIDATGIGSNAYTFFVDNDDMGTPEVIGEGEEFPRDKSTLREITVNFEKFGDEVAITMEAQEDGMIDMKARQVEDLARRMAQWLNEQAFEQLNEEATTSRRPPREMELVTATTSLPLLTSVTAWLESGPTTTRRTSSS